MKTKYILIYVGILILVVGAGAWIYTKRNPKLEPVGQSYPNLGSLHIDIGATHAPYNSNPPTSGPHYVQPAAWGIYQTELPDEQLVHNLEHGGIWISYNVSDTELKAKIEDLAKRYPNKMIVTPRARNDSVLTLASWTRLEKLTSFDEAKILEFITTNKNKSPEPYAQ